MVNMPTRTLLLWTRKTINQHGESILLTFTMHCSGRYAELPWVSDSVYMQVEASEQMP